MMQNSIFHYVTAFCLLTVWSTFPSYGQEVGAEADVSVEVEAKANDGQTDGGGETVAVSAANSPNSLAKSKVTGSLSESTVLPAKREDPNQPTNRSKRGTSTNNNGTENGGSEAEAEAEVESEAEAEVANGAAVAIGASSAAASGGGRSVYVVKDETGDGINDRRLYPANTKASVAAETSTATATSKVNIPFRATRTKSESVVSNRERSSTGGSPGRGSGSGIPYATKESVPIIQSNTESEVESEAEAEAEAVTAPGAAAAVATGGAATISAGDFAKASSVISVKTSTSTSEVNEPLPAIFIKAQKDDFLEDIPQFEQGKGTNEAEAESEAEAEAEAEVDNNSAAASAVASGAGGSSGIGASANAVASTSAVTSTEKNQGVVQGANPTIAKEDSTRFTEMESRGIPVSANVNNLPPTGDATSLSQGLFSPFIAPNIGNGDLTNSLLETSVKEQNIQITPTSSEVLPAFSADQLFTSSMLSTDKGALSGGLGNFEFEDEAEVEAEAEAETGFKAAAASASTTAVHARNGLVGAQGATRTAAATSVFGINNTTDDASTTVPYNTDLVNLVGIDPEGLTFYEVEAEAEAEAEVGYFSGAAAAAAAGTGYKEMQVMHKQEATPYAAAAAAGSGRYVTLFLSLPPKGEAGKVAATATASDPLGRGVAVAVAVAGVPEYVPELIDDGDDTIKDNEMEDEDEGPGTTPITVSVSLYTNPASAKNIAGPLAIDTTTRDKSGTLDPDSTRIGTRDPDTNLESEAETEVEAEAEAGYGVAAASIAAGAAGRYTFASGDVAIATDKYDGPYEFSDKVKNETARASQENTKTSISNLQASYEGKDAVLNWQASEGGEFAVDYLLEDGRYWPVGGVNGDDQTERRYLFRMLDVSPQQSHTFRVRSLTNLGAFKEVLLASSPESNSLLLSAPYPNPVEDHLHVPLKVDQTQHVRAKISDVSGKTVIVLYDAMLEQGANPIATWIPASNLPNGLYVLTVEGSDFVEREKVILAK